MPKVLGIAYTQEGTGPDVLLLHGWGANKESFALVTKVLAKKYRVTAIDFYGFGESDPLSKPYTVSDYVNRVEFFAGLLSLKIYALVCHSFGGRVAIKLLAANPDFARKLVLVDSAGVRPRRGLKYYGKVYTYKLMRRLCPKRTAALTKRFGSADYRELPEVMRETFKNVVNEDLTPYLSSVTQETLILWGSEDYETPLYMAKVLKKKIAGAGLVVIDGAGHFSFVDRPRYFMKVLDSFLSAEPNTHE